MLDFSYDDELQDFFRRLNAPLSRLPQQERVALHAEVREHLNALIAAHAELGASPTEAVDAALKQFGDPAQIGQRLMREWTLTHGRRGWQLQLTGFMLLLWTGGIVWAMFESPSTEHDTLLLGVLPLVVGIVAGLGLSASPVKRTLVTAAAALLIMVTNFLVASWMPGRPPFQGEDWVTGFLWPLFCCAASWAAVGSLSACLTSLLRRALCRRGPGTPTRA